MTIGASIALLVLGAILYFAVEVDVAGIDIAVVGVIMMIGGLAGLVLGLVLSSRGRARERTVDRRID